MRIHVDGIVFALQARGGISTCFRELLTRLSADPAQHELLLTLPGAHAEQRAWLDALPGVQAAHPVPRRLERYRACPGWARGGRVDLFHSTYYRTPADPALPSVVTVHDFAYERCVRGLRQQVHSWQKRRALAQARVIVCVSESTREDLLELMPPRGDQLVQVVPNGVSERFRPLPAPAAAAGAPFVLFVGQRGRYKNFRQAAAALSHLPGLELHCVGGGPLLPAELSGLPAATVSRIRQREAPDDASLNRLYNAAECLIYPSLYEGFGIPVVEALRAGCPVVSVDCKAVREVGGDALVVAENHPEALAEAVRRTRGPDRQALRERGWAVSQRYSWDRNHAAMLQAYAAAVGAAS